MKKSSIPMIRYLLMLSSFAFFLSTCSVNPVTGKKEIMMMSEKKEIAQGKAYDPQIVASFGLYEDEKLQQFIDTKGQKMAGVSHRSHLNYEFKILDSPVVNAFAVPGGYVYFTRGIMAHFNNEAEFAGVLGHEIGHITARHTVRAQTKQTLAQLGFIVGVVASKEFRKYADVAQQSLGLLFLKFSRDNESESDRLGVEYSTKIGYDANEMANFFNTLNRMRGGGEGAVPTFMSTHPDPVDRRGNVAKLAQKWQASDPGDNYEISRDKYLQMVDGLVFGEDPRQGYVEDNKFYHPTLLFEYPIPQNWKLQNSPTQVQMAPESGEALMVLKLGQGETSQAAAQAFVTENKLTMVENRDINVNGFSATAIIADQPAQTDPNSGETSEALRVMSYFIKYGDIIYQLMGVSKLAEHNTYVSSFRSTMEGFRKLTNQSKIDVKPERLRVVKIGTTTTLKNAFVNYRIDADQHDEMAIVNGMELTDQVKAGSYIKVLTR